MNSLFSLNFKLLMEKSIFKSMGATGMWKEIVVTDGCYAADIKPLSLVGIGMMMIWPILYFGLMFPMTITLKF